MTTVEQYLAQTGGRRGCPHPAHRMALVENSPASLILPECAGRVEWLRARLEGIGGSEVGALLGLSEYDTTFSIWKKKKDASELELTGAPIEWGDRLEEVVAAKTAEEVGLVSRFGGGLWADREKPFLRVTPDRFATRERSWKAVGLIECKTAGDDAEWASGTIDTGKSEPGTGSAPLRYQAQCQWQMGIIGLPVAYLGCLVLGRERQFFTVEVKFDREWFRELADEAERFWVQNILGDEIPMHDLRHPKTEEMLKAQHPKVERPSVQLPEDSEMWLGEYRAAKAAVKAADEDLAQITNYFRMITGDAQAGFLGDKKVTSYPEITASRINVEKLKTDYPEIAEKVTERSSYRRLTISAPKAKP